MAIIASDFHGNYKKLRLFLEYKPEEEHIYLGDILDSFAESPTSQLKCLNTLLESDTKLVWGNHELHYRKKAPFSCSGLQYEQRPIFQEVLEANKHRFSNAVFVDGYVCTHAGLANKFVKCTDPKKEVSLLNQTKKVKDYIYNIGYSRGGWDTKGGIFWYDHIREEGLSTQYNQVFGHTASERPVEYVGDSYHHVCINTWDTQDDVYVFDTEVKEIKKIG
jgi:hypothetical protein